MQSFHEKFYEKKVYLFFCMLFCLSMLYSQNQPGDVWLLNSYSVVIPGQEFITSVHVNTGNQLFSAYGFNLTYQSSIIVPETVTAGPDGFFTVGGAVNPPGSIPLRGFAASGKGPGTNLNVVQVQWKAVSCGVSPLNLVIETMTDSGYAVIGTPKAINNRIAVVNPGLAYGDIDGDGAVNIIDALMVAQYYVGLILTLVAPTEADVNADGKIDIVDALVIARYYVGALEELPVLAGLTHANTELVPVYPGGIPPVKVDPMQGKIGMCLKDAAGMPVTGKTVTFSVNKLYLNARTAETDSTGLATAVTVIPWDGGVNFDVILTAAFAGDTAFAPASCQVLVNVYSPAMPTPLRTPTPTPVVSMHGDYFNYSTEYNSPDSAVIFDDIAASLPYYYSKTGYLEPGNSISGYTGDNYLECYNLPTSMYFWVRISKAGNYGIGIRVYDTATSSWAFKPLVSPATYSFENGIYYLVFNFTRINTRVDRIVIYSVEAAESVWQNLSRNPNFSLTGSSGVNVPFTIN